MKESQQSALFQDSYFKHMGTVFFAVEVVVVVWMRGPCPIFLAPAHVGLYRPLSVNPTAPKPCLEPPYSPNGNVDEELPMLTLCIYVVKSVSEWAHC